MRRVVYLAIFLGFGCGEATDDPEDCTSNEYFDEGREICRACPAIIEPTCRDQCSYELVQDSRGCPVAQCQLDC